MPAVGRLYSAKGIRTREIHAAYFGTDNYNVSDERPQALEVSVKDGMWRGTMVGTMSTHYSGFLGPFRGANLSKAEFSSAVKSMAAKDRVRVSYDHGPGTARKTVAEVQSDVVTAVPLKIPLAQKGTATRVFYERLDQSGRVVTMANASRQFELHWVD